MDKTGIKLTLLEITFLESWMMKMIEESSVVKDLWFVPLNVKALDISSLSKTGLAYITRCLSMAKTMQTFFDWSSNNDRVQSHYNEVPAFEKGQFCQSDADQKPMLLKGRWYEWRYSMNTLFICRRLKKALSRNN